MSTMTGRLTQRYDGRGFSFAHPPAASIEVDPDDAVLESVVIRDADQPVMIAASLEQSPIETPTLQVPGTLGLILRKYEELGRYEQLLYSRLPVEGSDGGRRGRDRLRHR